MSKTAPTLGIIKINFKIERNVIDDYKSLKTVSGIINLSVILSRNSS